MTTYTGSCHCGAVRFTVAADLAQAITCNCSHCHRKGFVLTFVEPGAFTLLSGEDALTDYLFNTGKIRHRFCKTCGTQAFASAEGIEQPQVAINVRCLEDVDLDSFSPKPVNGKDF